MACAHSSRRRPSAVFTALLLLTSAYSAYGFITRTSRKVCESNNSLCGRDLFASRRKCNCGSPLSPATVPSIDTAMGRTPRTAASAVQSSSSAHESMIAGRIFPIFSKLAIDQKKAKKIATSLSTEAHIGEIWFMAALGLGTIPAARFFYERFLSVKFSERFNKPFEKSRIFLVTKFMAHAFQIGCAVYVVDVFDIILSAMGFRYFQKINAAEQFARVACIIWLTLLAKDSKKNLLKAALKKSPNKDGKLQIYDRLVNAIIFVATFMAVLDALKVNMSMALSSLISLGGVGTLIVSLASKDLAEQLVSGLAVSTQDRFYSGDEIKLGDGTAGIVSRIGWTHTDIRLYDETTVSIPNSNIFNQRVINLSRGKRCQVKQFLWFSYDDIGKMGEVCDAIKDEIETSCSGLITTGRPFRAHWRDYKQDHLEMVVDCHFEYPPVGDIYWDNRQNVLEAISRATTKCGVSFSLPTSAFVAEGGQAPFAPETQKNDE